jgi:hypothetical protein
MQCEVCGNEYRNCFTVTQGTQKCAFDCFECALHALAPTCAHCGCKIVGHGISFDDEVFCCQHCVRMSQSAGDSNEDDIEEIDFEVDDEADDDDVDPMMKTSTTTTMTRSTTRTKTLKRRMTRRCEAGRRDKRSRPGTFRDRGRPARSARTRFVAQHYDDDSAERRSLRAATGTEAGATRFSSPERDRPGFETVLTPPAPHTPARRW